MNQVLDNLKEPEERQPQAGDIYAFEDGLPQHMLIRIAEKKYKMLDLETGLTDDGYYSHPSDVGEYRWIGPVNISIENQ